MTWSAPNNQGCAITGYTVLANGGGGTNVGGGQTSATVGGLTNGTSYTFTVIARNEVGDSAASPASNAVVPAGPPCAPNITSATPDTGRVTVSWGAACPNGSPITQYQLATNGQWQNVGTGTSFVKTGLADATTYSFQVRAVNDVATGPGGNTVNARTPGPPGPDRRPGPRRRRRSGSTPRGRRRTTTASRSPATRSNRTRAARSTSSGASHTLTGLKPGSRVPAGPRLQRRRLRRRGARRREPPGPPLAITVSQGRSAVGQPVVLPLVVRLPAHSATGMASPNTSYQVDCFSSIVGQFDTGTSYVRADGGGRFNQDASCYFGYPGETVWVTLNGIRSNNTTW